MDNVTLARLIQSRTDSIRADLGAGVALGGGGTLRAKARARLQEADNKNQALADVFIEVTGVPEKAKRASEFAFKITLMEQGLYEWPEGKRPEDLQDLELTRSLCQPIYTVAISEVAHLAQRMGFNSVRIAWSLPMDGVKTTASRMPRTAKQPTAKPVTKLAAARRGKAK